ncbi:hypothetical protein AAVH_16155 [Aphelenchoides avenae]|nr:hypothetical protein AAVH_16155 [Aphelenchus avenae]
MYTKASLLLCFAAVAVPLCSAETDAEKAAFADFVKKYSREYKGEEFGRRLSIFAQNLKRIEEQKAAGVKGLGVNEFSDETPEEFKKRLMKIDPLSLHAANGAGPNGASSRRKRQSIPTSFDYRTYPSASQSWVSPVKNQGICGSCWAFATAAMHESVNRRYYGNFWDDYSEQILVDCTKGASISDTRYTGLKNLGCDGGWKGLGVVRRRCVGVEVHVL